MFSVSGKRRAALGLQLGSTGRSEEDVMVKPLLLGLCLSASVAACATGSQARYDFDATPTAHSTCIRETGTRIRRPANECVPVPGRSYSRESINNTGAITLTEALRMLDPAITATR